MKAVLLNAYRKGTFIISSWVRLSILACGDFVGMVMITVTDKLCFALFVSGLKKGVGGHAAVHG